MITKENQVQLNSIEFSDQIASNENPGALPATQINLSGSAKGFDDVNDLLLTLQRSAFFNPQTLKIEKGLPETVGFFFVKHLKLLKLVRMKVRSANFFKHFQKKNAFGVLPFLFFPIKQ